MNDRFRIRAWHKPTKRMFDVYCFTDKHVFENTLDGVGTSPTNPANIEDCILEQCTGLQDKNGRLIYEGDIVLLTDEDSFEQPQKTIVRWAEENASFGLFSSKNLYYGFCSYESENFEVIGNIHENPELLGGEK